MKLAICPDVLDVLIQAASEGVASREYDASQAEEQGDDEQSRDDANMAKDYEKAIAAAHIAAMLPHLENLVRRVNDVLEGLDTTNLPGAMSVRLAKLASAVVMFAPE